MSSQEVVYYQDGSVTVTNARAILGAKTYSMANITSVFSLTVPAKRMPGVVIALVGLLITICASCWTVLFISSDAPNAIGTAVIFGGGALLGLFVTVVGMAIAIMVKPSYVIKIGSASGEANALVSKDSAYISKIVNAMNDAIVRRG